MGYHAKVLTVQYILGYVGQYIRDHAKVLSVHLRFCQAVHQGSCQGIDSTSWVMSGSTSDTMPRY
jgi:hypothetical protein